MLLKVVVMTLNVVLLLNRLLIWYIHEEWEHKKYHFVEGVPLDRPGFLLAIPFNTFSVMLLLTWARASLTDPGFIPLALKCEDKDQATCKKCKDAWKPTRAHHCRSCERCVFVMDSHCMWINNCVGQNNRKFYL